jgi:predicted amidohydrolase
MTPDARGLYVGAAQIPISDSVTNNLTQILDAMARGAAQGLELLVCPETAVTGYSPAIGRGRGPDEWPAIEEALGRIAADAARLGLWVAVGTEAWTGEHWANRLVVYSDLGEEAAAYDKVHLTRGDAAYYLPGERPALFTLRGVRVGLQICYDVRFPEGYRALLEGGAEVILQGFYGAGGDTWKVPVLGAHLRSRAAESGCFVVAANVAGPLQIVVSQIVDPRGLVLAQANQDCSEIVTAELDLNRVGASEIRQDYFQRFRARS